MNQSTVDQQILQELSKWILSNQKLKYAIKVENIARLFTMEFPKELTIDLTVFEKDYYDDVFAYKEGEKNIEAFVKKVCLIIRDTIHNHKDKEPKYVFHIKHRIRKARKLVFIHPNFN